jgi:hypothetical protein
MKHMIATCAHLLVAPQWMLVEAELDAGTEFDAIARRSDLDCAQRESRWKARGAAEHSMRRKRHAA